MGSVLDAIQRFRGATPIASLIEARLGGVRLVRVASTNGGEWAGPCPLCGGADRLRVWPSPRNGAPRAWCRRCGAQGDAVDWAALLAGRDPRAPGSIAATLRDAGFLDGPVRGARPKPEPNQAADEDGRLAVLLAWVHADADRRLHFEERLAIRVDGDRHVTASARRAAALEVWRTAHAGQQPPGIVSEGTPEPTTAGGSDA